MTRYTVGCTDGSTTRWDASPDGPVVMYADVQAERERVAGVLKQCRRFIDGPMSLALPRNAILNLIAEETERLRE